MSRNFLLWTLVAGALAFAGCADVDESTGGGDCPDATTDDDNGLDNTANIGQATNDGVQESTGGGDCPDAAGVDDDPNVHNNTR